MSSTEPTDESPRRRRSPLAVASVAAAVLLAGGGGAYFATAASERDGKADGAVPAADRTPPPLVLDGHTDATGGATGPGPGIAPGEPDPGGVVYRAKGELPQGPDSAPVHRPRGTVGADEVARLAKALGVPGTPRLEGSVWKTGPAKDGSGPLLQVNKQAPGGWTLGTAPTGDDCRKADVCPSGGQAPGGGGGRAVSEKAAKEAAAPVLEASGQRDAALDATQLMGAVRVVNADPVVGGLPTYGWSTGIQVGPDGSVVGGSGRLKAPEKGDEYPVIGAAEALKLLNASSGGGPVGIGGCATPAPLKNDAEPAAPCEPSGATPAPKETVTISRAVFGLAAQFTGGREALVPSWLFTVEPKGDARPFTITYPAVAPSHLAPAPSPRESDAPQPEPSGGPRVQSYGVDGQILTVRFWGGVCSTYTAQADESGTEVRVKVVETPPKPDRYCIAMAKEITATVTLERPLDGRKVVDAGGEAVPRT
ncbi:hypothetical protein [Streptomyces sp. SP18CS02]|uniref:hypothetical protein n=1 Tax=Streptomyces sp. SP18CS02 TaxID=3002531 RepID=UPI002E78B961|nr:hypothetical protein [Streptomyces sp. SP18CS02]MEE1755142.1 hypothetical protein [Streptomyces sp. SP18CS02]